MEDFTTNEHFGLGHIRNAMIHQNENHLGLWADFQDGAAKESWGGFVVHPDEVSRVILELVWKRVSG